MGTIKIENEKILNLKSNMKIHKFLLSFLNYHNLALKKRLEASRFIKISIHLTASQISLSENFIDLSFYTPINCNGLISEINLIRFSRDFLNLNDYLGFENIKP